MGHLQSLEIDPSVDHLGAEEVLVRFARGWFEARGRLLSL